MAGRPEKYAALRGFFEQKTEECRRNAQREFKLRFRDLEKSGVKLPESAYKHREWWANRYTSKPAQRRPWQHASLETKDVNIAAQTVVFRLKGPFAPEAMARLANAKLPELRGQLSKENAEFEKRERRPDFHTNSLRTRLHRAAIASLEQQIREVEQVIDKGSGQSQRGMAESPRPYATPEEGSSKQPRCRHPIYGALKGYIRLVAGTDLTEPADPDWGKRVWADCSDNTE